MSATGVPGLSKARLEALCDGIFAIVMTLLVLEIGVPKIAEISSADKLTERLLSMWPELVSYVVSFALLASFWFAHHFEFSFFARTDRRHVWINVLFMLLISLVPASTALFSEFYRYHVGVVVYAGNMAAAGMALLWNWRYATHGGRLTVVSFPENVRKAVSIRLLFYPILFAFAAAASWLSATVGFLLCVAIPAAYIVMQILPHRIDRERAAPDVKP
ncbi:MAG: TMEM175 family protein [Proteobacteria bacterium]|jgi:uncharacterized membrane protein|nr:TMEM175 family protein [Pseudomonadota bacterium]